MRLLAADAGASKGRDVFISHATEDKEAVALPLAHALQEHGISVWYDEFELRIGDSLSLNPPVDILWLGVDRRGKCL